MDLTFDSIRCPNCNSEMNAASTQIGPSVAIVGKICLNCKQGIIIIPTKNDSEYKVTRITAEMESRRDEIIEEFKAIFNVAQILVSDSWILENKYNHDFYSPWLLMETPLGMIKIGWRKRVIQIDWSHTDIRKIISNDNVTIGQDFIHAWSELKAAEYLTNLRKMAESM